MHENPSWRDAEVELIGPAGVRGPIVGLRRLLHSSVLMLLAALIPVAALAAQPLGVVEPALQLSDAQRLWLAEHPRLRVATKQEWAPIDVYTYEGQFRGLSGDYLHLIGQRLNLRFEITPMPTLQDGLLALREGRADILPSVARTPQREAFMRFTEPYLDVPNVYLARRGVGPVGAEHSLAALRVAVERGYAVSGLVREHHPQASIVEFDDSAQALQGVSNSDADVYLGALPTTTFLVEKLLLTNLEIRGPLRGALSALSFGVAADNSVLQEILNRALDSITLAERQEIHRRWVPLRTLLTEPAVPLQMSVQERQFIRQLPALRIGYDEAHYPYTFRDAQGALTGMAPDYLALVAQRIGLGVQVASARAGVWSDVYRAAQVGEVDLLLAVADNEERRRDFLFVGPWISSPTVLVALKDSVPVIDMRQLYGKRVGVLKDGQHQFLLAKNHPALTLVEYASRDELLTAVARGEVAGSFSNLSYAAPKLQEGFGAAMKIAGVFPELNSDLYFAVRRDQPLLADLLKRALRSVTDAERAAIASRWTVLSLDTGPNIGRVLRTALPFAAALLLALAVSVLWGLRLRREVRRTRVAEVALAGARDHAEALARERQDFITTASHEIRTPVNAVIGALDLVRRQPEGAHRDELLALAQRSAATLAEFVTNLLDLSKSDAGKLTIHLESADLGSVLHEPIDTLRQTALGKGLTLSLEVDPQVDPRLLLDSMRLRQIVLNLLSNALRFTSAGGVRVDARVVAQDALAQTLQVSVTDTGCGIDANTLPTLFQAYAQADAAPASRLGGSGLGLQLCKRLVEAMGGSITLSSEVGRGTQVCVELRLQRAPDTAALPAAPLNTERRVLIADDDRVQQIILTAAFEARGFDVDVADDGVQALALWRQRRHALVLTDCRMPVLDGYGLAQALRAEAGGHAVMLIGTSADIDDGQAGLAAGMDRLLQKPLTDEAIADLLAPWSAPTAAVSIGPVKP
jgi:two-component system, NarL family, sensor histidine kinase EvgS